mmetsp:Transcript_24377/g.56427  ORF Transcript_24377/g.56427 Transcript_24377/m.56427 type:complete len:81 (-) Transcript_24377:211-453(-)
MPAGSPAREIAAAQSLAHLVEREVRQDSQSDSLDLRPRRRLFADEVPEHVHGQMPNAAQHPRLQRRAVVAPSLRVSTRKW